jgi:hypothetical protein
MQGASDKTIFLHVGVHKTGTTAIQVLFSQAQEALAARGVLYPLVGRPKDRTFAYGHHELPWHMLGRRVSSETLLADLRDEIRLSSAHTVVLSSEEFDRLNDEQSSNLVRELPAATKKVVFYYRRQADILQGLYGTEICFNREARPIAEFIDAVQSELNYLTLARRWAELVGRENIIARPYDRSAFVNRNVAEDFCSAVRVTLPRAWFSGRTDYNESLSDHAALSVQQLWKLGLPAETIYPVVWALQKALRGRKADYQFLAPSERRALDARFKENNDAFLLEFAEGQSDVFTVEETQSDEAWQKERESEIWAINATLTQVADFLLAKGR